MPENKIGLKSISELFGMKFFIPSYQRGYRWTEQQVKDLLEDIEEFSKKSNPVDFYCLQPLVVKESVKDKKDFVNSLPKESDINKDVLDLTRKAITKLTKWEVIDGQQRLTTLYILLSFLKGKNDNLFSLSYETRVGFRDFFNKINNPHEDENITFDELIKNKANYDNIDFYYILNAFNTIKEWFKSRNLDKNKYNDLLSRVKFIWYESVGEDPIKVFTRLNIGKIGLTNAELIKALFLNQSNFADHVKEHIRLKQQEIASEWDNIEYTLQNDEFWLFLHENGYNRPTRIDSIFELICEQNSMILSEDTFKAIGTDEYRTFRYFYEYFKKDDLEDGDKQENESISKIEKCWVKVKKYFQIFQEWFNDMELYHYVGYLVHQGEDLYDLFELWKNKSSKECFILKLKGKIEDKITSCKDLSKQYEIDGRPKKTTCKPLLLLHNIQTIINQNNKLKSKEEYKLPVFYKFPFHIFKKEKWDVEHIDSNTTNDLEKLKDQKEWLKYSILDTSLEDKNELKVNIKSFIKDKNSEISFEKLAVEINKLSPSSWSNPEQDKNKVWNFVLLDAGTNRGYGNSIFPAKRRCIIGKDQGKSYVIDDDLNVSMEDGAITFIPPVTKNVFLKYYNTSLDNLREWSEHDATAYKQNILETLQEFGVTDTYNNQNTENNVH